MPGIDLKTEIEGALAAPSKGHVFALMGPNGAGKSRLLNDLKQRTRDVRSILLPANRPLNTNVERSGRVTTENSHDGAFTWSTMVTDLAPTQNSGRPGIFLTDALREVIGALLYADYKKEEAFKTELLVHSRAVRAGSVAPAPVEKPNLVSAAEQMLENVLGYRCKISESRPGQTIVEFIREDDISFGLNALSDGEKQIAMVSVLLLASDLTQFIFFADEPELYLNETRAVELWEKLEKHFSEAVFLHATHNIVFATRQTVDRIFLMGRDGHIEEIDKSQPVPKWAIHEIVGARIQILRTDKPIAFCEDDALKNLLEDLTPEHRFEIETLGSHKNVISAASGEPAWAPLRSGGVPFCGVIDRDAKTDIDVSQLKQNGVFCFPYFEPEAILLVPNIAAWFLSAIGQRTPTAEECEAFLFECAQTAKSLAIRAIATDICDKKFNRPVFTGGRDGELSFRSKESADLEAQLVERIGHLDRAIDSRDVSALLTLFDSKALYAEISSRSREQFGIQLVAAPQMLRTVRAMAGFSQKLTELPPLIDWKAQIEAHLFAS